MHLPAPFPIGENSYPSSEQSRLHLERASALENPPENMQGTGLVTSTSPVQARHSALLLFRSLTSKNPTNRTQNLDGGRQMCFVMKNSTRAQDRLEQEASALYGNGAPGHRHKRHLAVLIS